MGKKGKRQERRTRPPSTPGPACATRTPVGLPRRFWWATSALLACEPAPVDDGLLPPDQSGATVPTCAPHEGASLRATLYPTPDADSATVECALRGISGEAESLTLALECDQARELVVASSPPPPDAPWIVGERLRVTTIRSPGSGAWLRVEDAAGRLLLAVQAGVDIDPPDGTPWASPFSWSEAPGSCVVEETACGATQRGAVALQLSGGAPLYLYEGTSSTACEKGAYAAYAEVARPAVPGSSCAPAYALGVVATRPGG